MKMMFRLLGSFIFLAGIGYWYVFLQGEELPSVNEIDNIFIFYSEKSADLLPEFADPKEFKLIDRQEITSVLNVIGSIPISKMPLMNSDNMDEGQNWVINIFFKNGESRYIFVDKKQINGKTSKESPLFAYLKKNYV